MPALSQNIGTTIAFLRKQAGLTQRALANRLGVTDKAVSRWERGIGMPDQSLLTGLAEALNVDIESILAGEHADGAAKWLGVVLLKYAPGLGPETLLFDRPALALQLGYLMLAGLDEIILVGSDQAVEAAKRAVTELPDLKASIFYVELQMLCQGSDTIGGRVIDTLSALGNPCNSGGSFDHNGGTMVIDGLDFIYGKDLTRVFRRQMIEPFTPTRLVAPSGTPLHVIFVPNGAIRFACSAERSNDNARLCSFVRGVLAFPIESAQDMLDASGFMSIIGRHQVEPFMELGAIARARLLDC